MAYRPSYLCRASTPVGSLAVGTVFSGRGDGGDGDDGGGGDRYDVAYRTTEL